MVAGVWRFLHRSARQHTSRRTGLAYENDEVLEGSGVGVHGIVRRCLLNYDFQSSPGMIRFMNASNNGTVNAVSPWLGLQIMPLTIN